MSTDLVIWTYDWVPGGPGSPRGFVRDLRLRWACEEAQLAYKVRSVPFDERGPTHFARQPFGQVPFLEDGEVRRFESGAALLHLGNKSEALMPRDHLGHAETLQWTIAALNSIEIVTLPWWFVGLSRPENNPLEGWMTSRLNHLDKVLARRDWLAAGRFTVADLLMADVLRVPKVREFGHFPALQSYVDRICDRPAFEKAREGQMAHFAAGDVGRQALR